MQRISLEPSLIKLHEAQLHTRNYYYENNFQKTFVIAAVSAAVVLASGLILFNINRPATSKASSINSTSATVATPSTAMATSVVSEIHIANNGLAFVQGARVTAISGDIIETTTSLDSSEFTWVVATTGATKFLNHQGQKETISDVNVGDILSVTGKLIKNGDQLTINAEFVRE